MRGKVAQICEDADRNPVLKLELTETGEIVERTHDLVVLAQGIVPAYDPTKTLGLPLASDGFVSIPGPNAAPCVTAQPGIFVTGTAMGPMDIVDSIISASAAASEASAYIRGNHHGSERTVPESRKTEAAYA